MVVLLEATDGREDLRRERIFADGHHGAVSRPGATPQRHRRARV